MLVAAFGAHREDLRSLSRDLERDLGEKIAENEHPAPGPGLIDRLDLSSAPPSISDCHFKDRRPSAVGYPHSLQCVLAPQDQRAVLAAHSDELGLGRDDVQSRAFEPELANERPQTRG